MELRHGCEEWVVIEAVHDAIGMAEQLSCFIGVPGGLVFGPFSFEQRYPWFRAWVNSPAGQRLAAQHDEITRLRRQAIAATVGNVRSLPSRLSGAVVPAGQETP